MSKTAVDQILRKASTDARFRAQLKKDFDVAVKPYSLTAAEKKQLRSDSSSPASAAAPERQAARSASRVESRVESRNEQRMLQRNEPRIELRNMQRHDS